uniref:ER membrane protein complex subunit 6 n=1 Tax=Arcella intermedia TaxID=1963864 RepID=A0A6B2LVB3_9EUKA
MSSLLGGCAAGILGLTSWTGFGFYLVVMALSSLLLFLKAKNNFKLYFQSESGPLFEGLFSGVMTYIMFWTLTYDIAYIYT